MLIGGILLGLFAGLALGGRIEHLAEIRLRYLPLLFSAVILRFATEFALGAGVDLAEALRLPLFVAAYGLLLYGLWANRAYPGLGLAFVGVGMNTLAIVVNGGYMPVWEPSLVAAGFDPLQVSAESVFHVVLPPELGASFLLSAGPLGDVIPIPLPPPLNNVASVGDLFLSAGLGFFLFATVLRTQREIEAAMAASAVRAAAIGTGPRPPSPVVGVTAQGFRVRAGTDRGGLGEAAMELPATLSPALIGAEGTAPLPTIAIPRPTIRERAARHPYVRLALNPSFSALWAGQLISQFGDRVHLVALFALIYTVTGSAFATALAFFASTLPNLILSPIAGAYVDRWNTKQVLVVSDILRAGVVLLIPVAALVNVTLVYPLVFAMTAITIFFRPAKVAILPRIADEEDLLPANSALMVGDTIADIIGYPLAGLFVGFLAQSLPLAFWFDAVTYLASAVLLAAMTVPPITRRAGAPAEGQGEGQQEGEVPRAAAIIDDLKAGWAFLRTEPVLLANTLQGALGQFAIGVIGGIAYVYADEVLAGVVDPETAFSFLETAIGVGNLVGGLALGLVAVRLTKGGLVIAGYAMFGVCVIALGMVSALPLAVGLMVGAGIANMIYVIPSQTLFQERTPQDLIGRVVGFRFAIVFGSMTIAAPIAGVLTEFVGAGPVIVVAGVMALLAAAGGLASRAVREA